MEYLNKHYGLLKHDSNICEYDPYMQFDTNFHDEKFGYLAEKQAEEFSYWKEDL